MPQIIYAWNYREWGGAQIYFMSLMREAKKSFRITALLPEDSEPNLMGYLNALEVPLDFLPPAPAINYRKESFAKLSRRLTIIINENRLVKRLLSRKDLRNSIVHIDLGFWQSFLPLFRLCLRTNVFMTVHTGLPHLAGWRGLRWKIKGEILSRFASFHLMASNIEARNSLRPYISASKLAQVEVEYSGFDPDEIDRASNNRVVSEIIRKKYCPDDQKLIVASVGQFIERKGCWILLESLRQLRSASEIDICCLWLSTMIPDGATSERISEYGLGDSFRLLGSEDIGETRDDLLRILNGADLFVLASLQEGLPIALVEALALGLPCIATSINAIPEAIDNRVSGILVPPNDPVQLKDAIAELVRDSQLRKKLGTAGKTAAFEKFNARTTARRMTELYERVWKSSS